jgi:hypothetical protein
MDLKRTGHAPRLLVLSPQKLEYSDTENVRIILSITDVTDARSDELKSALVKENALLLQEIQHRWPTAFRSSPAFCCKARAEFNRMRRAAT